MSELQKRIARNRELPRHLRELGVLLGKPVDESILLTVEQTSVVREKGNEVARSPTLEFELAFAEKQGAGFRVFVERLAKENPSDVYLWTPASNDCGVPKPVPLGTVNMDFPFDLNPEGILVLLTSDLNDRLLLDFSLGDNDEQMLVVEVSGEHWGHIEI